MWVFSLPAMRILTNSANYCQCHAVVCFYEKQKASYRDTCISILSRLSSRSWHSRGSWGSLNKRITALASAKQMSAIQSHIWVKENKFNNAPSSNQEHTIGPCGPMGPTGPSFPGGPCVNNIHAQIRIRLISRTFVQAHMNHILMSPSKKRLCCSSASNEHKEHEAYFKD